MRNRF